HPQRVPLGRYEALAKASSTRPGAGVGHGVDASCKGAAPSRVFLKLDAPRRATLRECDLYLLLPYATFPIFPFRRIDVSALIESTITQHCGTMDWQRISGAGILSLVGACQTISTPVPPQPVDIAQQHAFLAASP